MFDHQHQEREMESASKQKLVTLGSESGTPPSESTLCISYFFDPRGRLSSSRVYVPTMIHWHAAQTAHAMLLVNFPTSAYDSGRHVSSGSTMRGQSKECALPTPRGVQGWPRELRGIRHASRSTQLPACCYDVHSWKRAYSRQQPPHPHSEAVVLEIAMHKHRGGDETAQAPPPNSPGPEGV